MKKALARLGVVFLAGGAAAQSLVPRVDPRLARGFEAIREQDLRGDLTFLTSDALQGRMSLQPGSEVAIEWVAGEFQKAGLAPAAGELSTSRTFPSSSTDPTSRPCASPSTGAGRRSRSTYLNDFYGGFARDVTLSAPVVFAGYGISAPEFGYDDYAGFDVAGKIVVVFDHEPQENDQAVGLQRHREHAARERAVEDPERAEARRRRRAGGARAQPEASLERRAPEEDRGVHGTHRRFSVPGHRRRRGPDPPAEPRRRDDKRAPRHGAS